MALISSIKKREEELKAKELQRTWETNRAKAPVSQPERAAKWYTGERPTSSEAVARMYTMFGDDETQFNSAYGMLQQEQQTKGSVFYNPYAAPTNKTVFGELNKLGVDTSSVNADWFKANASLMDGATYGVGNAPTKGKSKESKAAYYFYQLAKDEENTNAVEADWQAAKDEINYWANTRADLNLSDAEVLAKLDIPAKYKNLAAIDESRQTGELYALNRPVEYGEDALLGAVWAARNGQSTGNSMADAVQYRLGRGNAYTPNKNIIDKRNPNSASYNPYMVGTTLDDEAALFGVQSFTQDWFDNDFYAIMDSGTDQQKAAAQRVWDAEIRTQEAEKQLAELNQKFADGKIRPGKFDDEVEKSPAISALIDGIKRRRPVGITRAIDFDYQNILAKVDMAAKYHQIRKDAMDTGYYKDAESEEMAAVVAQDGDTAQDVLDPKSKTAQPGFWDWLGGAFKDGSAWLVQAGEDIGVNPNKPKEKPQDTPTPSGSEPVKDTDIFSRYKGNTKLSGRPVITMGGDDYGTLYSITIQDDDKQWVNIPTIYEGNKHTEDEAIAHYYANGEHLGKYADLGTAEKEAQALSDAMGMYYNGNSDETPGDKGADLKAMPGYKGRMADRGGMLSDIPFSDKTADVEAPKGYVSKNNSPLNAYITSTQESYRQMKSVGLASTDDWREGALKDASTKGLHADAEKEMYLLLTDDEISRYNYIYDNQGEQAANDYYDGLKTDRLNEAYRQQTEAKAEKYATTQPVISSVVSVVSYPKSSVEGFTVQLDKLLFGKDVEENDSRLSTTAFIQKVREVVPKDFSEAGQFWYGTGLSIGDNLFSRALMGAGTWGGMYGAASAGKTNQVIQDGGTSDQALMLGAVVGMVELITEKMQFDRFTSAMKAAGGTGAKNFVKGLFTYGIKSAIPEGLEEGASFWADAIADTVVRGDESDLMKAFSEHLTANNGDQEAAWNGVARQYAKDFGLNMLGGAVSGFMFGEIAATGQQLHIQANIASAKEDDIALSATPDINSADAQATATALAGKVLASYGDSQLTAKTLSPDLIKYQAKVTESLGIVPESIAPLAKKLNAATGRKADGFFGLVKTLGELKSKNPGKIVADMLKGASMDDALTIAKANILKNAVMPKSASADVDKAINAALMAGIVKASSDPATGAAMTASDAAALVKNTPAVLQHTVTRFGQPGIVYIANLTRTGDPKLQQAALGLQAMPTYAQSVIVAEENMKSLTLTPKAIKAQLAAYDADMGNDHVAQNTEQRATAQAVDTRAAEIVAQTANPEEEARLQQAVQDAARVQAEAVDGVALAQQTLEQANQMAEQAADAFNASPSNNDLAKRVEDSIDAVMKAEDALAAAQKVAANAAAQQNKAVVVIENKQATAQQVAVAQAQAEVGQLRQEQAATREQQAKQQVETDVRDEDIPKLTQDTVRGQTYRGLEVRYNPSMKPEARNRETYIELGNKFFDLDDANKISVMHHEVAHNLTSELLTADNFAELSAIFLTKKIGPTGSKLEGQPYWEGLFGDVGSSALVETVTDAIVLYLDAPERLMERSARAYEYLKTKLDSTATRQHGQDAPVNAEKGTVEARQPSGDTQVRAEGTPTQNAPKTALNEVDDKTIETRAMAEAKTRMPDRSPEDQAEYARRVADGVKRKLGRGYNAESPAMSEQNQAFFKKVEKKFGLHIVFDDSLVEGEEGFIDNSTRTIHLNPNATVGDAVTGVVAHELAHFAQQEWRYSKYRDAALTIKYGKDYENSEQYNADVKAKIERYARGGKKIDSNGAVDELVAQITRNDILADTKAMDRLLELDVSLGQKVLEWLDRTIANLKSVFTGDDMPAQLLKARDYLAKALDDRAQADGQGGAQYSLADDDAYLSAVGRGDMDTAQRMVDEKAKQAGYTIKAYHGTDAEFTEFKRGAVKHGLDLGDGFYFSPDRDYAAGYGKNLISAYLRIENPYMPWDSRRNEMRFSAEEKDKAYEYFLSKQREAAEKAPGYDRFKPFVKKDGGDFIVLTPLTYQYKTEVGNDAVVTGNEIAIEDASQIKSADPVTYSDTGAPIPLSARFNPESNDIRYSLSDETDSEGRALSVGQQEYFRDSKVRDGKGRLVPVYHGTEAQFNTFRRGDIGFHFGTKGQARMRAGRGKSATIIPAYLNLQNPLKVNKDYGSWTGDYATQWLLDDGYITQEESNKVSQARYDKKDAALRQVLKDKGYDGVEYVNFYEGGKTNKPSYIAFDSNQIKRTDNLTPTTNPDIRYSLSDDDAAGIQEAIDRLTQEYGAIPQGELASNPRQIPAKTAPDKAVGRFARTVSESGIMNADETTEFDKRLVDGEFSHTPISDKAAMDRAQRMMENAGIEGLEIKWRKAAESTSVPSKFDIAAGEKLLIEKAKSGDTKGTADLVSELVDVMTRAGQRLQAAKLLKRMSNEGILYTIERSVRKINADSKGDPIIMNPALVDDLLNAKTEDERTKAGEAIRKDLGEQIPPNWRTRLNAWRHLAMLGNPRTHIRNIVGNAIFMPAIKIKNIIGAGLEAVAGKDKTKAVILNRGLLKAAKADAQAQLANLQKGGKFNPTTEIEQFRKSFGDSLGGRILEWLSQKNSDALEAEDAVYLKRHYATALAGYLQANGLTLNSDAAQVDKARQYAYGEALKATYRDVSSFANWLSTKTREGGAVGLFIEGVVPFKKTPANILKRGIEYSPIGLVDSLTRGMAQLKKGNITQSQLIDKLAAGMTGTMIAGLGAFLSSLGLIKAGFREKKDELGELTGEQEYALEAFGMSFTIDWMTPIAMPLFVGASLMETFEDGAPLENVLDAFSTITEPMFNLSMLEGVNNIIKSASYGGENAITNVAQNAMASYLGQYVPTLGGQIARTIDPLRRRVYTQSDSLVGNTWQRLFETIQNKLPVLSMRNTPYTDALGRPDSNASIAMRALENFILPGYVNSIEPDGFEQLLKGIYDDTKDERVLPKTAAKFFTVNGKQVNLTDVQQSTYAQARGKHITDTMTTVARDPRFSALDPLSKASLVAMVYDYGTNIGKKETIPEYKVTPGWMYAAYKKGNVVDTIFGEFEQSEILGAETEYRTEFTKAVSIGDYDAAETAFEAMLESKMNAGDGTTNKKAASAAKTSMQGQVRSAYVTASLEGDTDTMTMIEDTLADLGIDYDYEKWLEE